MTVGESKLQFVEKKVPDNCKIYMAHSKLDCACDISEKMELSAGFYDNKEREILFRAKEE